MSKRPPRVFDKVKWHTDGSSVLPGVFLGWAVRRGLTSDEIAPNDARGVDLLIAPPTTARAARMLAHRQLERKLGPVDIASCYGILASVGDATSLAILAARPPLRDPYKKYEKSVMKSITRRLKG